MLIIFCVQGVASPILANIYLHELDEFLAGMKARFDRGKYRQVHMPYQYLSSTICKRRHLIDQLRAEGRTARLRWKRRKSRFGNFRRNAQPCQLRTGSMRSSAGCSSAATPTTVCHERTNGGAMLRKR